MARHIFECVFVEFRCLLVPVSAHTSSFRLSADIIDWTPGLKSVGSLQ